MDISQIKKMIEDHSREDEKRFELVNAAQVELLTLHQETQNMVKDMNTKMDGYFEFLKALSTGRKLLLATAMIVGAIVGVGAGLKVIIGWFK